MRRANRHDDFGALLQQYIRKSLYSYGQLARLSGVPKRTIVNWIDGTVRRPRQWQSVLRAAAALRLTRVQIEELFAAAELPELQSLVTTANSPEDQRSPGAIRPRVRGCRYPHQRLSAQLLSLLSTELARLPAHFPEQAAFTFAAIYQDLRLRRIEPGTVLYGDPGGDFVGGYMARSEEGEAWSLLREQMSRAVILGQPGMGKTWLLRAEAIRLAEAAPADDATGEPKQLPLLIRIPDLVALLAGQTSAHAIFCAVAELAARATPTLPEGDVSAALLAFMEKYPQRLVFLLDALDEVPDRGNSRTTARIIMMRLSAAMPARILLTSRTLGYAASPVGRFLGPDVVEYELLPFTNSEISRVMRVWFHGRTEQFRRLQIAMRRAPALVRQASNPLLLSLMCMLNETHGEELTGNRSGLYEPVLRLLLEGRWRSFDMQLPEGRVHSKLRLLEVIAWCYATYRQTWWEQLPGDVLEQAIERFPHAQRLWATWRAEWGTTYEGPLWELSEWDGILIKGFIPADGAVSAVPYAFLHRTFQEYLVARYLVRRYADEGLNAAEVQEFLTHKTADPDWYVVLLLLVEQLTINALPDAQPFLDRLSETLLDTVRDRTGQMAVAAVEILVNLHITEVGAEVARVLRDHLLSMMRQGNVNPFVRIHAGRLVAQLGDPRPAVVDVDGIEFVEIPGGPFTMGSDPAIDSEAFHEEMPQHLRTVGRFAISRYPISNAQFRLFYEDREDGYFNPVYWPEAIALGHWREGMVWRVRPTHRADGTIAREADWAHEPYQQGWPADLPNSPVMGIGWYEARAFVRWLESRWRRQGIIAATTRLDLPSETEWEKAARGTDGRIYPWGNEFDGNRLNWRGHMLIAPAPIGAFPNSASPYGVEEMVGNLWEWTRSIYRPYDANGSEDIDFADAVAPDAELALRGGAYFTTRSRCRCAARMGMLPFARVNLAFRIVKVEVEA